MLKRKPMKAATLVLCLSLIFTVPVYANSGWQGAQNGMQQTQQNIGPQFQQSGGFQFQQSGNGMQTTQNAAQLSNAAQFMVNKGIMKGDTSGNYALSNQVKRGDMTIMLVRAFDLNTQSASAGGFADVSKDSYYYDAIQTVKSLGIAQGNGQSFQPENYMTLQEAILFVERAITNAGYTYSGELADLFSGRSLSEYATREDVSVILYAVLGYITDTDLIENVTADVVAYETDEDTALTFDGEDFNDACEDATDETLSCVKFTLPSSSYGRLYYDYESSSSYDSRVSSSTKYYYDGDPSISDVTFVPASGYTGTVKISYTGYNEDGDSFTGTVKITVE